MTLKKHVPAALAIIACFLLLALPHFLNDFYIYLLTNVFILAFVGYSFKMLYGGGYLTLGLAGFYAIGGYTFALFQLHVTGSLYLLFLAVLILSGIAGLIIGFFCVKRKKMYFAALTLAFSELIHVIIWQWRSLFAGDEGIPGIVRPPLDFYFFQLPLKPYINFYYFVLIVFCVCAALLWKIQNSNFGYVIRCIRDNPERASFAGVNVRRYVLVAFVISSLSAGLAGALHVCLTDAVDPGVAGVVNTVEPQIATLIGGVSAFGGPFLDRQSTSFLRFT